MEQLWCGLFLISHHTVLENTFVAFRCCVVDVSFGCFLIHSDSPTSDLFIYLFIYFKSISDVLNSLIYAKVDVQIEAWEE